MNFYFQQKTKMCASCSNVSIIYFDRLHIDSTPSFIINTPQSPCYWSCFICLRLPRKNCVSSSNFAAYFWIELLFFLFVLTGCVSYLNGPCSHFYCPSPTISEKARSFDFDDINPTNELISLDDLR